MSEAAQACRSSHEGRTARSLCEAAESGECPPEQIGKIVVTV